MTSRPHVVIIGGGFGGLAAARALADAPVNVTLIDRRNHHLFQPLLYQVATAALNPSDIAYPIRAALATQANARVLLAAATAIDVAQRRVELDDGALAYDYLVVATGATHSYFGRDDWAKDAPGLKSVEDALEIRRRIFLAYEAAEREADPVAQREWLTFAVVGAGPTGVGLAGALGEIGLQTLAHDFRNIDSTQVRVLLFEGRDRILGAYPPKLSDAGVRALESRHVDVRVNAKVIAIDPGGVTVHANGHDERIGARTVAILLQCYPMLQCYILLQCYMFEPRSNSTRTAGRPGRRRARLSLRSARAGRQAAWQPRGGRFALAES